MSGGVQTRNSPAYPAARKVAEAVVGHFARRAEAARAAGKDGLAPTPDAEAVEAVINALDTGVSDATEAHRTIVTTLARELGLDYGAAWSVDADGARAARARGRAPRHTPRRVARRRR